MSRNELLWSDARLPPHADSPLRTAGFWWDHYQIEFYGQGEVGPTPGRQPALLTLVADVAHTAFFDFDLPTLGFYSSAHGSALRLGVDADELLLAYQDDAHPMPECLRWVEADAIARYLEVECGFPSNPRLALLLLAPFVAVVTTEEQAHAASELRLELAGLHLLDEAALDVAVRVPMRWRRLPAEWAFVGWVPDDIVGWALEGTWTAGGLEVPIAHSLRRRDNAAFPAAPFLRLLKHVGAREA